MPEPSAVAGECFSNVAAKVARDGGTLLYGWTIWEWPRVFVEAEHHAIWKSNGKYVDITPHVNNEDQILFLPDPQRVYDFRGKKRLLNRKKSLGVFASAENWIEASDHLHNSMEEHSVGSEIRMKRTTLTALWESARNAQAQVLIDLASTTKVNSPCFCNSGKKFKKCCAPLIDLTRHS
ncbi:SEC-C metal-binding domain-containing protein [Bradyrhizobium sp. USDA 3315]